MDDSILNINFILEEDTRSAVQETILSSTSVSHLISMTRKILQKFLVLDVPNLQSRITWPWKVTNPKQKPFSKC